MKKSLIKVRSCRTCRKWDTHICKPISKQDQIYKKTKVAETLAERASKLTAAGRFLINLY